MFNNIWVPNYFYLKPLIIPPENDRVIENNNKGPKKLYARGMCVSKGKQELVIFPVMFLDVSFLSHNLYLNLQCFSVLFLGLFCICLRYSTKARLLIDSRGLERCWGTWQSSLTCHLAPWLFFFPTGKLLI